MVYHRPFYIVGKWIYENTKEMINDNYKNYLSNFNKSNYFKY